MMLFIDCEWNGYRGELISIALAPEDRGSLFFYEETKPNAPYEPWVKENVVPHLGRRCGPIPIAEIVVKLDAYLSQYDGIEIIADWPEDIERFCELLIVGPGQRMGPDNITFRIIRDLFNAQSEKPHHAAYDAKAIRDYYLEHFK